jgi:adenosylcobinamide hydrolase
MQMTRQTRTRFRIEDGTLIIDLGKPCPILSSAPRGGGLQQGRYILNHQVQANPIVAPVRRTAWEDPARYLGRVAEELGVDRRCTALMTAVPLKHLVVSREERDGVWVEGFFTVGLSNAVRAGEPIVDAQPAVLLHRPGTINIVLITNARLASAALVGAVQVATEGKTAALLVENVRSWRGTAGATGTGTDAIVIACGHGPFVRYSGTHTMLGAMIGRVVSEGVREGMAKWKQWKPERARLKLRE